MKCLFVPLLLSLIARAANGEQQCISPTGIGENPGEIPASQITSLQANIGLPYIVLVLLDVVSDAIAGGNYETPIQFRFIGIVGMNCYNVLAAYQPNALDIWGRGDRRLCVNEFASPEELNAHEQLANVYSFAYGFTQTLPESLAAVTAVMENILGLPMSNVQSDSPDPSTPWGLAQVLVDEMADFMSTDGWNANGSLSGSNNKMPYKDFEYTDENGNEYTPYKPNPSKFKKTGNNNGNGKKKCKTPDPWNWEPLEDTNGFGFFCRQEHVTPHIGFTGRLLGLTEEDYESFSSPLPNYDWCEEADFVVERTRDMATSDTQKMEVEFFDNKFFSLVPLQVGWQLQKGQSLFEFWFFFMALDVAMYDATLLVWRDKVLFDLVRPTTVVHNAKADEFIETFAGPGQGVDTIKAQDWQPFVRTMPHAEYPSGSSCICTTFAEIMTELTGSDSTQGIPLQQVVPAGSSKTEPGTTPATDLTLVYNAWSEVAQVCGGSRVNGGMHFSQAVPAGEQLCTGVASLVVDKALLLLNGDPAGAMADFDDRSIRVKSKAY